MIEQTIHIGPVKTTGGMQSVILGYQKLFGLPSQNCWASHSFVDFLMVCLKIFFENNKNILCYHLHTSEKGSIVRKYIISRLIVFRKQKYILHLHGRFFQTWYLRLPNLFKTAICNLFKTASAITCIDDTMKQYVINSMHIIKNIYVIPNFCESIIEKPIDFATHKEPVRIVFCGTFVSTKGVFDLIAAFEKCNFNVATQLDMYGNGNPIETKTAAENCLKKNDIRVLGWINHSEYLQKLSSYDLLVLPSYTETFGLGLVEAMGFGIPVISTFAGAIPNVVENKSDGLLVQVGDIKALAHALETLVNDKMLRIQMGKNAWNHVKEKFSPMRVGSLLELMYANVCQL
jgi:glycosyltransferase involved in cell wall biosynthesis